MIAMMIVVVFNQMGLKGANKMMNMYEKCCNIREMFLRRTAEILIYNWGDDFSMRSVREIIPLLKNTIYNNEINPSELTREQLELLGFRTYDNQNNYLVPLWLYPFLNEELTLTCIDGTQITKKSEMDTDNRHGMLAYYVTVSE